MPELIHHFLDKRVGNTGYLSDILIRGCLGAASLDVLVHLLEYIHNLKLSRNIVSYTISVRATITVGVKASSHGALLVGNHHGEVTNARKMALFVPPKKK